MSDVTVTVTDYGTEYDYDSDETDVTWGKDRGVYHHGRKSLPTPWVAYVTFSDVARTDVPWIHAENVSVVIDGSDYELTFDGTVTTIETRMLGERLCIDVGVRSRPNDFIFVRRHSSP